MIDSRSKEVLICSLMARRKSVEPGSLSRSTLNQEVQAPVSCAVSGSKDRESHAIESIQRGPRLEFDGRADKVAWGRRPEGVREPAGRTVV